MLLNSPIFKGDTGGYEGLGSGQFFNAKTEMVGKSVRPLPGVQHAELRYGACVEIAAQDIDALIGIKIGYQIFVAVKYGAFVLPCLGAPHIVRVGVDHPGHHNLADLGFQHLALLLSRFKVVASIHNHPAFGPFHGNSIGEAPAAQAVHAVGNPLGGFFLDIRDSVGGGCIRVSNGATGHLHRLLCQGHIVLAGERCDSGA